MSRPRRSTAGNPQQRVAIHRRLPAFAALGLALSLTGCSSVGLPMGERGFDRTVTGSISTTAVIPVSATKPAARPVAASDWDAIRQTIPSAIAKNGSSAWSNATTGSTGTVTLSEPGRDGCRAFSTTVSDVRGIRHYRGDACKNAAGLWSIGDLTADDAILS